MEVFSTSAPAATDLSSILGAVGDFVEAAQLWIADFIETIAGNPLLLMFVIISVVGFAVGLIRRLINLG